MDSRQKEIRDVWELQQEEEAANLPLERHGFERVREERLRREETFALSLFDES